MKFTKKELRIIEVALLYLGLPLEEDNPRYIKIKEVRNKVKEMMVGMVDETDTE